MQPRAYQQYAVDCLWRYFAEGSKGHPIVAMPTGTGKSVVIAQFIKECFTQYPHVRLVLASAVKEILTQDLRCLLSVWPTAPVGVYSAGLRRKELYAPITIAGIDSIVNSAHLFGHIDIVLIDECHMVSPKEDTVYQTFLADLARINPRLRTIGFTATHYRLGQGDLIDGGLFTDVAVDMTGLEAYNWFVDQGYLCQMIARPTRTELDVSGVGMRHGDFAQHQLQVAVDRESVTRAAIEEAIALGADRQHWIGFACGVEHAEHCAQIATELGVPSTVVHSKMLTKERDRRLADYVRGQYRCCWNNGVLTTGFDFPAIDLNIVLRPTTSPGLHVQILGRSGRACYAQGVALSTQEGRLQAIALSSKPNCLVLDFAGNVRRLGPINDPIKPRKKCSVGQGEAPVKVCPQCTCYCHASVSTCPYCQHTFERGNRILVHATEDQIIKRDEAPQIEDLPVSHVAYRKHTKGGVSSLKVSYHCGLRIFQEWLCYEHTGYPKHKAHAYWRESAGTIPPATVDEALQRTKELRAPKTVTVWLNKHYPEVRSHGW